MTGAVGAKMLASPWAEVLGLAPPATAELASNMVYSADCHLALSESRQMASSLAWHMES